MSFILDALKKSENERQRQSGPALFEVKVAAPRSRLVPWAALLVVAVAAINVLLWLLLRAPHGAAAMSPAPAVLPQAGAMLAARTAAAPAAVLPAPAAAAPAAPSATAPAPAPSSTAIVAAPETVGSAAADDDAPAVEPARAAPVLTGVVRATDSGLPTYQDAAATLAGLPDLRLDLHAFDANPDNRFVFINMVRLREGDALPQGVRVESITPDGAILSFHGSRFVLLH